MPWTPCVGDSVARLEAIRGKIKENRWLLAAAERQLELARNHLAGRAQRCLGIPNLWGGSSPKAAFGCSGLVLHVHAQIGIGLSHAARTGTRMMYGCVEDARIGGRL